MKLELFQSDEFTADEVTTIVAALREGAEALAYRRGRLNEILFPEGDPQREGAENLISLWTSQAEILIYLSINLQLQIHE